MLETNKIKGGYFEEENLKELKASIKEQIKRTPLQLCVQSKAKVEQTKMVYTIKSYPPHRILRFNKTLRMH